MNRVMHDSITASDIPASATMVAGYIDGLYQWKPQDWARFPKAQKVGVAVMASTPGADVYDVEQGDLTPNQVPSVLRRERAMGRNPSMYVNRVNIAQVRQACIAAGLPEPPYWCATLDGTKPWAVGIYAIQFAGSNLSGGHYDLSDVADYWPGVDEENDMFTDADRQMLSDVHAVLDAGATPKPNYHGFADTLTALIKALAKAVTDAFGS